MKNKSTDKIYQLDERLELEEVLNTTQNGKPPVVAPESGSWLSTTMSRLGASKERLLRDNRTHLSIVLKFTLHGTILGYFVGSAYYWYVNGAKELELCHGFGSLVTLLFVVYFFFIYFMVAKVYLSGPLHMLTCPVRDALNRLWRFRLFRYMVGLCVLAAMGTFLYFDTYGERNRLVPLLGLVFFLLLGFVFSAHPGRVGWRAVLWGLILQVVFGLLTIRWQPGRVLLQCLGDKVATFLGYGVEGSAFVFGDLLVYEERAFAFSTLPVVFFFATIVEVLFYWGALQWVCLKLGGTLQDLCGTTMCESVICVGNCFLGSTESVLLVRPYFELLTASELHTIMASGFATVSGTVLAAYISFGAEAAHLITASIMSAPATICYAKLLFPEVEESKTSVHTIQPIVSEDQSALSAATRGASNGIQLLLNIVANLVAFIALVAFTNGVLAYAGGMVGFSDLSLEWIFGKVFIPVSWLMGVPWDECEMVGTLIGLKTTVNEFIAYQRMGEFKQQGLLSVRAETIATYALCGFTNPGSAGIMIGAMSSIAPNQRETLSKVAMRAFFAGCGICFMTACIAGLLMPEGSFAPA